MSAVERVVRADLCIGCGSCAGAVSGNRISMVSARDRKLPRVNSPLSAAEDAACEAVCPAVSLDLRNDEAPSHVTWGPLLDVRTGWSGDPEIRFKGSSGGAISALLVHLLETGQADFVAHVGADERAPLMNVRRQSRDRAGVLAGAGSRYAPSSPVEDIEALFATGERFAFVGKPCDVAAVRAHLARRPEWRGQVVALISFMCAGVPSMAGTHEVLAALGTSEQDIERFDYRGNGWPGFATAVTRDGRRLQMDYNRSWGEILGKHLLLRCKLCPDGTGEFADVVCADAWHGRDGYPDFTEREGRSLILTRTRVGEALVQSAMSRGALVAEPCEVSEIARMQPYQLSRKQVALGRWAAALTRYKKWPKINGLRLFANAAAGGWLPVLRNAWGTFRRLGRASA